MPQITMLVTDVTNVGDERCVAGWDLTKRCMIRPEPSPGAFWPSRMVKSGEAFEAGAVAAFWISAQEPDTRYPHRTEDRIVEGAISRVRAPNEGATLHTLRSIGSPHIQHIFNGKVQVENERAFVPLDTKCASLGGTNVRIHEIGLVEDVIEGHKRLRCRLKVGNAVAFPSVTATDLRRIHATQGFQAVRRHVERNGIVHLRVGLSRLFTGIHGRCYVQINGIYGIG